MIQSTSQAAPRKSGRSDRPRKPRPDFPLFPHATGRWAKKVRGRFAFFGKVADDPDGSNALDPWLEQRDDLLAGRKPRAKGEGLTLAALTNAFLTAKQALRDSGELAARTWGTYYSTCERVLSEFGKHRLANALDAQDFGQLRSNLAKNLGAVALGNEIQRVRSLFKFAFDSGLIVAPVRFGPLFQKPSKRTIRLARQENGARMLEAAEIRAMLAAAGEPLRTMLLLGINCAFGNGDIGTLPIKAIDLDGKWIAFARKKSGISRRIPLWEETAQSIRKWLPKRPAPQDLAHFGLVFITKLWTSVGTDRRGTPIRPRTRGNEAAAKNDGRFTRFEGRCQT